MTCVVGYVEKGTVYMACDSAASDGESICVRKDLKIFNVRNMLFGFCGSYRIGQIIKYVHGLPRQQRGQQDHEFLCTTFVDCLIENLEVSRALLNDNGTASLGISSLLIGYKGAVYRLDSDMHIALEETPYCSIGSGNHFAVGAMYAMADQDLSPKERLTKAIMAASENAIGVKPPIHVATLDRKTGIKFL